VRLKTRGKGETKHRTKRVSQKDKTKMQDGRYRASVTEVKVRKKVREEAT